MASRARPRRPPTSGVGCARTTDPLHTGHCVIDCRSGAEAAARPTPPWSISGTRPTTRSRPTWPPGNRCTSLAGFAVEGFGAPWVDAIEGNCGTVAGLSMSVLRRLLGQLGVSITELWKDGPAGDALTAGGFRDRVEAVLAARWRPVRWSPTEMWPPRRAAPEPLGRWGGYSHPLTRDPSCPGGGWLPPAGDWCPDTKRNTPGD